jgi:MFS family permease
MRLKLSESPVFQAMKEAGETAGNPFTESFSYPGNKKRIFVALFGITGVLTTIWYTAFFSGMSFLRGPMRVDSQLVEIIMLIAASLSMVFYIWVGKWSDRVGRKKPIIIGALASLALLFPIFWGMGALANPKIAEIAASTPVVVAGKDCATNPFADLTGATISPCGKILESLSAIGVPYSIEAKQDLSISAGKAQIEIPSGWMDDGKARAAGLKAALTAHGHDFNTQYPPFANIVGLIALLIAMGMLSALTYGSVAALLAEMFPPKIRYSSMSIPYHIGAGYLGGFLPLIAGYIVAVTGNAYSGLWYTWAVVAFGVVVAWWGLPDGPPRDFADDVS